MGIAQLPTPTGPKVRKRGCSPPQSPGPFPNLCSSFSWKKASALRFHGPLPSRSTSNLALKTSTACSPPCPPSCWEAWVSVAHRHRTQTSPIPWLRFHSLQCPHIQQPRQNWRVSETSSSGSPVSNSNPLARHFCSHTVSAPQPHRHLPRVLDFLPTQPRPHSWPEPISHKHLPSASFSWGYLTRAMTCLNTPLPLKESTWFHHGTRNSSINWDLSVTDQGSFPLCFAGDRSHSPQKLFQPPQPSSSQPHPTPKLLHLSRQQLFRS